MSADNDKPYNSAHALADYIQSAVTGAEDAGKKAILVAVPKPFVLPLVEARQIIAALRAEVRITSLESALDVAEKALRRTDALMVRPAHIAACGAYRNDLTGAFDLTGKCTCGVDAQHQENVAALVVLEGVRK